MKNLLVKNHYFLFFLLIFLSVFSILALKPEFGGDGISYIQTIEVMKTGISPEGFVPNRIITTFLGLKSVMVIDIFVNNLLVSWLILNSLFFVVMGMFFYFLLLKIFDNSRMSILGTLFLTTNYAAVALGLSYFMDMGGWAFYVASLYFSYLYLETKNEKWLWISSILVGVGGLFKEYAFLAYIVILGLIIFINWGHWKEIIKKIFFTGLVAFTPMIIMNIYSFFVYDYTYLSWYSAQNTYDYQNKLVEYIKSFGSLYNFGWFLFIPGIYLLLKRSKEILKDQKLFFIWLTILSSLVVFVWPVVTRVLFITLPATVLVSCLFLKKIDKRWYMIVPLLIAYVLSSYLMNAYILDFVDIQKILPF
ncbi:MAG: glycosyltransferase family 39 protein [Nanoarchaeota archaeon]|nr:glycosyltransferase family 39 protein [Nanoarchaeota archaeon]